MLNRGERIPGTLAELHRFAKKVFDARGVNVKRHFTET